MEYESDILKRLIKTYGVVGNPHYISEIIKEFIVQGKGRFPELFTYQADWLAHIDEFGLNPSYTVSYTGQSFYVPNTLEKPVKSAILKGQTVKRYKDNLFDGIVESGGLGINSGENDDRYPSRCRSVNFIKVEPNSTITFARNLGTDGFHVVSYNENKEFIKGFTNVMKANVLVGKINTTSDIYYIKFYDVAPTSESEFGVFQGDVEPTYELASVKMPVLTTSNEDGTKTNILTVNEDVELRGIGDIKDELNLLTGEVTERIGEIVLDGSEDWVGNANFPQTDTHLLMQITLDDTVKNSNGNNMVCDKMQATSYAGFNNKEFDFVCVGKGGGIHNLFVKLSKDKLVSFDKNGFNNYFSQNPITVQYELATPIVKTVDLTILDQYGQNVKQLISFKGGTHFNTKSLEGSLTPSVSVTVETDLVETLKVCSLEGNTM